MIDKSSAEWRVCVSCFTYNQASYILECLNGFTIQETTFPFVCTIVDDASTDGEQDVIKKYLEDNFNLDDHSVVRNEETEDYVLTFAQHKTNINCYFAVLFLKYNHYSIKKTKLPYLLEWQEYSKYIAKCEGDDFWTHPLKLQKLTAFLESHPKYVLACHRFNKFIQKENRYEHDNGVDVYFGKAEGITFGRYYNRFINWRTQTLSVVYRKDVLEKSTEGYSRPISDGILGYFLLKYGKGFCFNEHMATYRVNQGGVHSSLSIEEQAYLNLKIFTSFDSFDRTLFSKLSLWESHLRILRMTHWKGYKDVKNKAHILLFAAIYIPVSKMIGIYYYKIKNLNRS